MNHYLLEGVCRNNFFLSLDNGPPQISRSLKSSVTTSKPIPQKLETPKKPSIKQFRNTNNQTENIQPGTKSPSVSNMKSAFEQTTARSGSGLGRGKTSSPFSAHQKNVPFSTENFFNGSYPNRSVASQKANFNSYNNNNNANNINRNTNSQNQSNKPMQPVESCVYEVSVQGNQDYITQTSPQENGNNVDSYYNSPQSSMISRALPSLPNEPENSPMSGEAFVQQLRQRTTLFDDSKSDCNGEMYEVCEAATETYEVCDNDASFLSMKPLSRLSSSSSQRSNTSIKSTDSNNSLNINLKKPLSNSNSGNNSFRNNTSNNEKAPPRKTHRAPPPKPTNMPEQESYECLDGGIAHRPAPQLPPEANRIINPKVPAKCPSRNKNPPPIRPDSDDFDYNYVSSELSQLFPPVSRSNEQNISVPDEDVYEEPDGSKSVFCLPL